MKHNSTRIALRWYFRLEIVCLCLTLAGVGSAVAAGRTAYTAQGTPAAVRSDTPVSAVVSRLPDKPAIDAIAAYAPLLPAPLGNLAAVFFSFQKIVENDLPDVFGNLHNFLR